MKYILVYNNNNKVELRRLFKRLLKKEQVSLRVVDHYSTDGSRDLMDKYFNEFIDKKDTNHDVVIEFSVAGKDIDKHTCLQVLLKDMESKNFTVVDLGE